MAVSIALGLLAALLFGSANFMARFACRAAGVYRTMLYGQWLAAPLLTIWIVGHGIPHGTPAIWVVLVFSNLLLLAATAFLCRALSKGRLAVVAPVAASYGGISALLSALTGASFSAHGWIAIGLITLGCVLVAASRHGVEHHGKDGGSGLAPAAGAAIFFGAAYWLQGAYVVPVLGSLAPVWSYYLLGAILLPLLAGLLRVSLSLPSPRALGLIAATTLLAVGAYLSLSLGLAGGAAVIVPALSALSSTVTVILGRLILKERNTRSGWIGMAAVVAGLALLRIG